MNKKDLGFALIEFTIYCLLLTKTAVNKEVNECVIINYDKYYSCLIDNLNLTYPMEFFVVPGHLV